MQKIKTGKGTELSVAWCGLSTIDGALRFAVLDRSINEVFQIASDPEEMKTLTHCFDENETMFFNYTTLSGVNAHPLEKTIIVALNLAP